MIPPSRRLWSGAPPVFTLTVVEQAPSVWQTRGRELTRRLSPRGVEPLGGPGIAWTFGVVQIEDAILAQAIVRDHKANEVETRSQSCSRG